MAEFTVTTLADSGAGSLREAIDLANASSGADVIKFDASLKGGTILGGGYYIGEELTIDGDIDNDKVADITLDGQGTAQIIRSDGALTIDGLNLTRGNSEYGDGGAIESLSLDGLTIMNSSFSDNTASSRGGAVFAQAQSRSSTLPSPTIIRTTWVAPSSRSTAAPSSKAPSSPITARPMTAVPLPRVR